MWRTLVAAASFVVPLCASAQTAAGPAPAFDPSAYGQYLRRGHEVAVGKLTVLLPNGTNVAKRGATVMALPDAPYTRWWLTSSAQTIRERDAQSFADVALPERLRRFAHYAVTDADGNFEVADLPRGRYIFRGRLSVAFPRAIAAVQTPDPYAAYGATQPLQRNSVVFDYSVVWLDSQSVRVGDGHADDVAFHLVARRDRVDTHRS
ncbi:MAG: hypothetical protein IAI50_10445 [Candidatus Eremiobacteraeota bacterium]|nr:hypothetical protein [Candidatus Eremiobacteraeota bacterium]